MSVSFINENTVLALVVPEIFLAHQIEKLRKALVSADAHLDQNDCAGLDRHMAAISKCVAACDAYDGPWLDVVRHATIQESQLPKESVEAAIQYGHQQAQIARRWREKVPPPRKDKSNVVPLFRTGQSTIDALLYELRSGLSALKDQGCEDRLRRCDEVAMLRIAAELLSWKDKRKAWLPAWSEQDVETLLIIRRGLK